MSRAVQRRYRVRFAIQGATEVTDSTVDFILNVPDLHEIPVVAGSFVHPLDGATEMRPVTVRGVDYNGALIDAFVANQRWTALGRLVDIQWQDADDDPVSDPWTTYGTGRCSGLDELDGPGLFRIEISDESWIGRTGRIFTEADTTSLWPAGLIYNWRGLELVNRASGTRGASAGGAGNCWEISLTASGRGTPVTNELVKFCRDDAVNPSLQTPFGTNFKNLRLWYDNQIWEVNGFGAAAGFSLFTLEQAEAAGGSIFAGSTSITCWVVGGMPNASGDAYLYSPTSEPSDIFPLHVGVVDNHHKWGNPPDAFPSISFFPVTVGGWLHPADLTRRVWEELGMRYDVQNLYDLEQDTSFDLVAPYILEVPEDAHKWMQENIWGPRMLMALRDSEGRMKLADLRPPAQSVSLASFPRLDNSNSRDHHWRLVREERINSITWEYQTFTRGKMYGYQNGSIVFSGGAENKYRPSLPILQTGAFGDVEPTGGEYSRWRLDDIQLNPDSIGPFDGDTVPLSGKKEKRYTFGPTLGLVDLNDPIFPTAYWLNSLIGTGRGSYFGNIIVPMSQFILDVYQDGPIHGTCEVAGSLAETIEEGDYAVVNCGDVKIANPFSSARYGLVLVLILSITRFPTHAEIEYLLIREALVLDCPDPDDSTTWVFSPANRVATIRFVFLVPEPVSPDLLTFYVQAFKTAAGGHTINMVVTLLEGFTEIAQWTESDVSDSPTDFVFTLTDTEQASITDWTNLYLEITREGDTGGASSTWRKLVISGIWV